MDVDGVLARIVSARDNLDAAKEQLFGAVGAAREAGCSWTRIGESLGVTRQAAQERFSSGDWLHN